MQQLKILLTSILVTFFITACATTTSSEKKYKVGNVEISIKNVECNLNVNLDGFDISVEGLEFPNGEENPWKFTVGKFEYKPETIEKIKVTAFYYDRLAESACTGMVAMSDGETKNKYISDYIKRLSQLTAFLATISEMNNEADVLKLATDTLKKLEKSEG